MNFILPQFIDMETKVIGPLTLKQFIYLGIGGGASLFLYMMSTSNPEGFPLIACLAIVILIMLVSFALAFVKVNGITLPVLIKHSFLFNLAPKIYLWKKFPNAKIVNPNQGVIKIVKGPASKKADRVTTKKSELKKLRNFMETKGN
ncbi:MAG TPA: PrgI family protein [Candidatus Paceibacterota bacterium]|nr:PrgI family protein [Candidatus Pacearchaeota archaeon]HRZ51198.1 PrgI family protein [Candidatus Paceibacterota bacterium]HSA36920.1 PrgI family protein [Candidatus Paceibacterota bacterium]